ncbi:MAG: hypothetical protein ABIQ12_07775 [Opitutaceae bacterium]
MSTSKNTKSKAVKSPAPATKPVTSKLVAPKPTVTVTKKIVAAAPVAVTPSGGGKAKAAPAPKPVASKPVRTTVSAQVNVGFGNALFIRGEGAGLSWEEGVAMECVSATLWRIVLPESAHGHTFKFLVNDLSWSVGADFKAASGASVTLSPEF